MPAQGNTEKSKCFFLNKHQVMKVIFLLTGILVSLSAHSQYPVNGSVFDTDGRPLTGANIIIRDSYLGTVSNTGGEFGFKKLAAGNYHLIVSYIGYESEEKVITVPGNSEISFYLKSSAVMGEEAIVTSVRAGQKDPMAVSEVTKEQLRSQNLAQDIPWLLSQTPSLVASSDAGAGVGYTGFRIRGTDANRINVTINGIPLNDAESHSVYFVDMPDFAGSTENIQIQRGVGTSQNGAAAFGASINIQTLSLNREPYSEISSSYGSFNTSKNSVSFGTGLLNDHFSLDARLSGIHSDGYIDRAFSDLKSYFVSAGWHESKSIVKLNVFSGNEKTYQAWDGVPGYLLQTNRTYNGLGKFTDKNGTNRYYENQTDNYSQDHYQFHISRELSRYINLNTSLHFTHGEGYYEEYKEDQDLNEYRIPVIIIDSAIITTSDLIRQKWLDNNFYGVVFSSNYKKDKIDASIGGAWNHYDGNHFGKVIWARYAGISEINHTWYKSSSEKTDYNAFTKINYSLSQYFNLYWDFQVRGIQYFINGEDDDHRVITQSHNYFFFNPKFGVNYADNQGQRAYFSFSVANREPNRSNFVDADTTQPAPAFETLYDYELGYSYKGSNFQAGASLYYMDYRNQLVLTGEINDVGSAVMTNVKDSYRAGIEFTAGLKRQDFYCWDFTFALSSNKIRNFVSYVDNWSYWDDPDHQQKQYVFNLGKTDIAFSPEIVASSNFRYFLMKNLSLYVVSKYVGRQFTDNTSSQNRKLDPWFVNDLRFEFLMHPHIMKELSVNLSIANIFNYQYSSNAWVYSYYEDGMEGLSDGYFPQAGINFMAGIRARF
jgi:iron complex outermembrane receptor protein